MLSAQSMAAMDDDHLISSLHAAIDPLTSTPAELELLRRFEAVADSDQRAVVEAVDECEFDADDIRKLGAAVGKSSIAETLALLDALAEEDITSIDQWKPVLAQLEVLADSGIETADALKARLELADRFRGIAADAGDVLTRLHELTQTVQE